jgi:hypothetical protein
VPQRGIVERRRVSAEFDGPTTPLDNALRRWCRPMSEYEASTEPASDSYARFVESVLHDGEPDWEAIPFDVLCSRCGYNLRMLPRPRCPECGLEFEWQSVLDRSGWTSDFLFEHNWQKKPIRSWLATVWRSFRPSRFWREVSLYHRTDTGPLWFMLVFSGVAALLVLLATAGLAWLILGTVDKMWPLPQHNLGQPVRLAELKHFLGVVLTWSITASLSYLGYILSMTLLMLALLLVLSWWPTIISRCQSRWAPLLRFMAYTASPVLILWNLWLLFCISLFVSAGIRDDFLLGLSIFGPPPLLLIAFLGIGLKRYLRLPRPWVPAVVSLVGAALITLPTIVACAIIIDALISH